MIYLRFVITALFFAFSPLAHAAETAEEQKNAEQPNVENLQPGWWSYFSNAGDQLRARTLSFESSLNPLEDSASDENKKVARSLIEKIKINLNSYLQAATLELPKIPQPTTFAPSYTIQEILDLYRNLRRQQTELNANTGELNEKQDQLQTIQEKYKKSKEKYDAAEGRSQEKLLLGLETVAYRTNLEVIKKNLTFIQKTIEAKNAAINHLEEEIQAALRTMTSSDLELYTLAQQVKVREDEWEAADTELKRKEAEEQALTSEALVDEEDTRFQLLSLETDQAEIKDAIAENQFILSSVELALARVITDQESVNLEELRKRARSATTIIQQIRSKLSDWTASAERQVGRIGQMLAREGKGELADVTAATAEQKKILSIAQDNLLLIQKLRNELQETDFLLDELKKQIALTVGGGERWLQQIWDWMLSLVQGASKLLNKELVSVGETSITTLAVLRFILIILVTFWIAQLTTRTLKVIVQKRKGVKKSLIYTISRLINYLLLAVGFLIALSSFGFDFSNLVLIMSALGVGIGFGLQSIFNNFISGIIILFESHLKVGDYVELESGLRGEIREINVRSTLITDNDGVDVLVPNSEIISNKVLNWTLKMPYRRIHIPFSVAYGTDKELVQKIVLEAAKKVPHTLEKIGIPEPRLRMTNLGDNGIEFELVIWIKGDVTRRYNATRSDYLWAIETALRENKVEIPFPQRDIHIIENVKPPGAL
ncbi:MAG: mechanosensitive ion channel [Chlamydiales bacterium]|nr:mechanosensitive ion channel [Chlamydiia bacterium]MCP5508102.1 mechanosensitive ion channel [Chlamydiales bacterium]